MKIQLKNTPPPDNLLKFSKLSTLFKNPSSNLFVQLFRYVIVGGTAFVADFGLLALLTELGGLPYQLSACVSFAAGLAVNYLLSIVWVFGSEARSTATRTMEFLLFAVIGLIGLGMNSLIMWAFTEVARLHYLVSKLISTIIVFAWNFLARRTLINHFPLTIWKTELTTEK